MSKETTSAETTRGYHPLLPIFLRILAVVLFFYWGLTHLIYPQWYLVSLMGITQYDPGNAYDVWSANLMGVLNVSMAIAIWRAASDPRKFRLVIDMILMVSAGTVIVFVHSILMRGISSREWFNAALIVVAIIVLTILYPRERPEKHSP
jgi:hypothetical protein